MHISQKRSAFAFLKLMISKYLVRINIEILSPHFRAYLLKWQVEKKVGNNAYIKRIAISEISGDDKKSQ